MGNCVTIKVDDISRDEFYLSTPWIKHESCVDISAVLRLPTFESHIKKGERRKKLIKTNAVDR